MGGDTVMTVSAAEKFTSISYSGRAWTDYNNLVYGGSGEAYGSTTGVYDTTGTVKCAIPNFITSLATGTEFESLKITFSVKQSTPYGADGYAKLTTGSQGYTFPLTTSYVGQTLDGDAAYWGLSGTPQAIFSGLKDGSIKFEYYAVGDLYAVGSMYLKEVIATLTYKLADTKRASILIALP